MRSWKLLMALLILAGMAGGGWWQRQTLLSWYYIHRLTQADELDREDWLERLVALDEAAVPTLVGSLCRQDADDCTRSAEVLERLAAGWDMGDPRWQRLTSRLAGRFPRFSPSGQRATLDLVARWVKAAPAEQTHDTQSLAMRLLPLAARSSNAEARGAALALASTLIDKAGLEGGFTVYRDLVRNGLEDPASANRVQAVRLASHPEMNLLPRIGPLLDDTVAEVRQAAMLAIGSSPDAVATDDLLRSLHDQDPEVRRLCEAALKSRGLRGDDLALARLITDAKAGTRLQVLQALQRANDLDPEVWLRRLSHDPVPAVRAAVLRAAAEQYDVDLQDRLEQIAGNDPSPTVRQIAEHYRTRGGKARNAER